MLGFVQQNRPAEIGMLLTSVSFPLFKIDKKRDMTFVSLYALVASHIYVYMEGGKTQKMELSDGGNLVRMVVFRLFVNK